MRPGLAALRDQSLLKLISRISKPVFGGLAGARSGLYDLGMGLEGAVMPQSQMLEASNPVLEISRLGPLRDTSVEIAPLTVLTGPPGQGKTYILNALFSELLPADLGLVGACFFRGRQGDRLRVVETLYEEKIIEININNLKLHRDRGTLKVGRLEICVYPERARRKLEQCLKGWLYPRESSFRFFPNGLNSKKKHRPVKLITRISNTLKLALLRSGFEAKGKKLCVGAEDIAVPVGETGKKKNTNIEKLITIFDMLNEIEERYAHWTLTAALLSSDLAEKNEKLRRIRETLDRTERELGLAHRGFTRYRPVYSWIGRGLVAMAATEPVIGDLAEASGVLGMGLSAFLPVYSMVKSVKRGLALLETPNAPRELGLLLELAKPAVLHEVKIQRNRLVLIVGDVAVPFRLAHGSALSMVGLILSAGPLLQEGSGYLLVDEAEHLLHPTAQAIMGLVLLGIAGAGIRVVATTHSTAITAIIAKLAQAASRDGRDSVIEEAKRLYEVLGYKPPRKEALNLVAEGALKKPLIYVVNKGEVRALANPIEWIDELTDAWFRIASWAGSSAEDEE